MSSAFSIPSFLTAVYQEFTVRSWIAFRSIVPELHDRTPLTRKTALYPIACYIPFVFLAYLSRRPDTYLLRLLLLPGVLTCILIAAYHFMWTQPMFNVYNWGQCLFAACIIAKALEFSLRPEGMLKIGEIRPGVLKGKRVIKTPAVNGNGNGGINGNGNGNGHHDGYADPNNQYGSLSSIGRAFSDAIEVIHTMRGLQWQYGRNVRVPKHHRPLQKIPFLSATMKSFLVNVLIVDFFESLIKQVPGVGRVTGGSIFNPELALIPRYCVSTTIHMMTGTCLLAGFGMIYDLITLIAVGLFNDSPISWPPVMENPWVADSMHVFWAKDWHQLLRQTFLVLGGYPGQWLAGDIGLLFGIFIASGLFHECSMYAMGHGFDFSAPFFFTLQAVILLLEQYWRKVTGKRVHGTLGRLWVYFIMFIVAQPTVDSWHRRGLGGGMVIPPLVSPMRQFLIPAFHHILH